MIDHMWQGRLTLSDRLIAVKQTMLPFKLICEAETLRRASLAAAKSVRDRLKGRAAKAASSALPKQTADHFSGRGHRHLRDKGDLARILVG